MRYLAGHMLGIEQGSIQLFSDFRDGGPMWTGEGPREVRADWLALGAVWADGDWQV